MNVDYLKIDGVDHPVKWNTRAKINWEKDTGIIWNDVSGTTDKNGNWLKVPISLNSEQSMQVCFYALKEGYRIEGKKFDVTLDKVIDWDGEYGIEVQLATIIFGKKAVNESEKK